MTEMLKNEERRSLETNFQGFEKFSAIPAYRKTKPNHPEIKPARRQGEWRGRSQQ